METAGSLSPEGTRYHTEGHSVEGRTSAQHAKRRHIDPPG
jgi:hypothetical protein